MTAQRARSRFRAAAAFGVLVALLTVAAAVVLVVRIGLPRAHATFPTSTAHDIDHIPASITADCTQDVTTLLTRWLRSVPDGSTATLSHGACYRTDIALQVADWHDITLDGNGAVLERDTTSPTAPVYPRANPILLLTDATDVTLEDLTVRGPDKAPDTTSLPAGCVGYLKAHAFDAALLLRGPRDVKIDGLAVSNVYGDGIQIEPSTRQPQGVTVLNSVISSNGRQSLSMVTGSDLVVNNLLVGCSRRSGIDLEPNTSAQHISDVTIENCTFTTWLLAISAGGPGTVDDVRIVNNTIHRSGVPWLNDVGTTDAERSNWLVLDNRVSSVLGSNLAAMRFAHTSGVVVRGNTVRLVAGRGRPVELIDSTGTVTDNTFLEETIGARCASAPPAALSRSAPPATCDS